MFTMETSTQDLNEQANIVESYEEAMDFIKKFEDIIKTNKKNIMFFAYQQDKFLENLRKTENVKVLLNNMK